MSLNHFNCPTCKVPREEKSRFGTANVKYISLVCGHMLTIRADELNRVDSDAAFKLTSLDNKSTYKYQVETAKFIESSGHRSLVAHEMGVGKTICSLAWLNKDFNSKSPFVIFCKSSLKIQWQREIWRWVGTHVKTQVIDSPKDYILAGFDGYIISLDLVKNLDFEKLKSRGLVFKTAIVDECQHIKNHLSQRTLGVKSFITFFQIRNIIGLSGTPIKNHAGEYFSILNILRPELFPNYDTFVSNECDYNSTFRGRKVHGLRFPGQFHEKTKDFIIRYTRAEVLPDLPKIDRQFHYVEFDERAKKVYNKVLDKLVENYKDAVLSGAEESGKFKAQNAEMLNELKHLVGLAKINSIVDWITEWLESHVDDNEKLTVFVHHKDVHSTVLLKLNEWLKENKLSEALSFTSDLNSDSRQQIIDKFRLPEHRIMLCSTLAGGEGINLQFCNQAAIVERQWNPANEEQAEARFPRPGSIAQSIPITYIVAIDSVDDELTKMVEKKRAIFNQVVNKMDVDMSKWDESSIMIELTSLLVAKRNKEKGM